MSRFTHAHVAVLVAMWVAGCGGDSDGPDDGERDAGRGDARMIEGGSATLDGSSGDGDGPSEDGGGSSEDGGASDDSGGASDDAGGSADDGGSRDDTGPTMCSGSHPMVEGDRRFCAAADCYCPTRDACFAASTAMTCCGDLVVCGAGDDAGPSCLGSHPMVEGARRFCAAADCYCPSRDACFGAGTAAACCGAAVVCAADGGDAGPGCGGTHPIVEGDRRFCASGDCYCATTDTCFSAATADACCAGDIVCRAP
ncbi:MAG: hypothetical protein IT379_13175 [Deltaproteobacteria bacterium]|nr:hypothetical protein [Deltaproteobacteria bacterium]